MVSSRWPSLATALLCACCTLPASASTTQHVLQSDHIGTRGAVASESAICSRIGIDMLAIGGNAADAMVATTLCVGTIGMYHSGIGGGGLMLIRSPDGDYETIDFREAAPAAGSKHMYRNNIEGATVGGLAVAVPGDLKGLEYLHKTYGKLPWKVVVEPTVKVARDGFPVTEDLVRYCNYVLTVSTFLIDEPVWAQDFAPNGRLVKLGETITRKRYANTLETIGNLGVDAFYSGELAEEMVALIQTTNGTLTLEDFRDYEIISRRPISIDYRGMKLFSTSAPSSGSVMLSTLKTMEQYSPKDTSDVNLTTHRFIEAMRYAYGSRLILGDPDFIPSTPSLEDSMISASTASLHRSSILDNSSRPIEDYFPHPESPSYPAESHGTSHIVTTDASGLTISSTSTINLLFGAQIMTAKSGIILNNEMDDFSIPQRNNSFGFPPTAANFIAPRKRPLSSISPIIAEFPNGTISFVTGAAGGSRIISSTTQVAYNLLEMRMDMHAAMEKPRFHDQLIPNVTTFEVGYENGTVSDMLRRGHDVEVVRRGISSVQGIRRLWDGRFEAVGEPRQENSGGFER